MQSKQEALSLLQVVGPALLKKGLVVGSTTGLLRAGRQRRQDTYLFLGLGQFGLLSCTASCALRLGGSGSLDGLRLDGLVAHRRPQSHRVRRVRPSRASVRAQLRLLCRLAEHRDGRKEVVRWRKPDGVKDQSRHSECKATEDGGRQRGAQERKVSHSTVQRSQKGATDVASAARDLQLYRNASVVWVEAV